MEKLLHELYYKKLYIMWDNKIALFYFYKLCQTEFYFDNLKIKKLISLKQACYKQIVTLKQRKLFDVSEW